MINRFSEQELIQLTDRDNLDVIDDTVINQAIDDASAEIDGYLAKYTLPLANVPSVLNRVACDIARYFLYDDKATEQVTERYEKVTKFLLNVSKGVISLGVDSSGNAPQTSNGAQMQSGGRVFSRDDNGFL
jgi:phage gp36-like protein